VPFPIKTDGAGQALEPIGIPNATTLKGLSFYFQAFVHNGVAGGLSNAVLTRICP